MQAVYSAAQMRKLDERAIRSFGIPSLVLMERAALAIADQVLALLGDAPGSVCCVCGSGNNGGDGLALARLLHERGHKVSIYLVFPKKKGSPEFETQLKIVKKLKIPFVSGRRLPRCDVLVDCVFGTGLDRAVAPEVAALFKRMHSHSAAVVSADIPSGISADTGQVLGEAVKADVTVALQHCKIGHLLYPGCLYSGRLYVAGIGIPPQEGNANTQRITEDDLTALWPWRDPAGNKGSFGKILFVTGDKNMAGASILSAKAALKSGAGMVKILTVEENREILQRSVPEALLATYQTAEEACRQLETDLLWADAVVCGCGLGKSERAKQILEKLLSICRLPLTLDADALNLVSSETQMLRTCKATLYLTPHVAEFARLCGKSVSEIKKDPLGTGSAFAKKNKLHLLLKDAVSCAFDAQGSTVIYSAINSALATAGTGDVLAGIVGTLSAQAGEGVPVLALSACLHGRAAARAEAKQGKASVCATDLLTNIPAIMKEIGR